MQPSRWGEIREEWKVLNWCNLKVCQQEMVLSLLQWNPLRLNLMEWKLWPEQKVYTYHSATLQQQGKRRKELKRKIYRISWKEFVYKNFHQVQGSLLQFTGYLSADRIEYLKKHQNLQIVKWSIDNILFMKQFVTFPPVNMMDTLPITCQDKMKLLKCHSKLYSKIGFLL